MPQRHRPDGQQLDALISRCRSELRAAMADVDSIPTPQGRRTRLRMGWYNLYGYTEETSGQTPPGPGSCRSSGRS